MSIPPLLTLGELHFFFRYHPYLPSDPRPSDFVTIMCALFTKQYPAYPFFLNLMTLINISGENLWRFRLCVFRYLFLKYLHTFQHELNIILPSVINLLLYSLT